MASGYLNNALFEVSLAFLASNTELSSGKPQKHSQKLHFLHRKETAICQAWVVNEIGGYVQKEIC